MISIHAPHTGRDDRYQSGTPSSEAFQSTRPIRGATVFMAALLTSLGISIHAPHTGRDMIGSADLSIDAVISIHAPHTGRDESCMLPLHHPAISIHAPHTGRDNLAQEPDSQDTNFNPRAPYGARQQKCIIYVLHFCNNRQLKHKNQQETSSVRTFF